MKTNADIHIGTSGWHYHHWKGTFYPEDLANEDLLAFYADRFHTVEINNSFYNIPEKKTLRMWRNRVPREFIFSVKASRYITHMKKLKQGSEPVSTMLSAIDTLGDTLGPILFQLPPRWKCNPGRLQEFLSHLPDGYRYTFEFRDETWLRQETYDLLKQYQAAFCIYHLAGFLSPKEVTAPFVYIRLHGPGAAYEGRYDTQMLAGWAGALSAWQRQGKDVYCYFDNDQLGYAAQNAAQLQEMIS